VCTSDTHCGGRRIQRANSTNEVIMWPANYDLSVLAFCEVSEAVPLISPEAVDGLKFSAALPRELAVETLGGAVR